MRDASSHRCLSLGALPHRRWNPEVSQGRSVSTTPLALGRDGSTWLRAAALANELVDDCARVPPRTIRPPRRTGPHKHDGQLRLFVGRRPSGPCRTTRLQEVKILT